MKNNFNLEEYLKDDIDKIVILKTYLKKDGKVGFSPWQKQRNQYLYKGTIEDQDVRLISPSEIVIEFDFKKKYQKDSNEYKNAKNEAKENISSIAKVLKNKGYEFHVTDHKGKCPHLRFRFIIDNDEQSKLSETKKAIVLNLLDEAKVTCEYVKLDEGMAWSLNKLIPIEGKPHFKRIYNSNEEVIFYNKTDKLYEVDMKKIEEILQNEKINLTNSKKNKDKLMGFDFESYKKFLKKYWEEGYRNNITLATGGLFHKYNYSYDDANHYLEDALDSINAIEDYEEASKQMKYCFEKEKSQIAVKKWFEEFEEPDKAYQELLNCFRTDIKTIICENGNLVASKSNDGKIRLRFYDDEGIMLGDRPYNKHITLNMLNRFIKDSAIPISEEESNNRYKYFIKSINLIKNNKTQEEAIDALFEDEDYLENNQLIFNDNYALTLCKKGKMILLTKDEIKYVDETITFNHYNKIDTIFLSKEGFHKWKNKIINFNIIEDLKGLLKDYLFLSETADYLFLIAWIFHTYLFNLCGSTIYIHFTGIKDTGKSTTQKVLNKLCFNSDYLTGITESSLFRSIDENQGVIHIDELDKWSKENPDGRWRCYSYEEILERDKTNLDIFWIKDKSLDDLDNLPEPDVIASELVQDLENALEQLREISTDLNSDE
jgi:hypothetical protein